MCIYLIKDYSDGSSGLNIVYRKKFSGFKDFLIGKCAHDGKGGTQMGTLIRTKDLCKTYIVNKQSNNVLQEDSEEMEFEVFLPL